MADYYARHIIEALRSGVPSRAVGHYFSEARPKMMRRIQDKMEAVRETGQSDGMIFTGRYGEGKTHLLNTVFDMASSSNMVVSFVSLGKETPVDKLHLLYPKIMENTYLPGALQPGLREKISELTKGSSVSGELMAYAAKELTTDKLYYLLKAYLGTQEEEERDIFLADIFGEFTTASVIKKSYKRVTGNTAKITPPFSKTKHAMDYFYFASHLIKQLGYDGWVILFDEAELLGRLGKKTRAKSYVKIQSFLNPEAKLEGVFSLFAFSSSFAEDVIDKKNEMVNADECFDEPEEKAAAANTLKAILNAPELAPLNKDEIMRILNSIQEFYGKAYDWTPDVSEETLYKSTEATGYLLRTRLRAAIEFFDQLYQYGEAGETKVTALGKESYEEDSSPELPNIDSL